MTIKLLAAVILATGVFAGVVMNLPNNFGRVLHMRHSASAAQPVRASITGLQSLGLDPVDVPHFNTLPAIGVFAEGGGGYTSAQCAAALDANASSYMYNGHPINQETVPQNQQPHSPGSPATGITSPVNQTKPNVNSARVLRKRWLSLLGNGSAVYMDEAGGRTIHRNHGDDYSLGRVQVGDGRRHDSRSGNS